MKKLGCVALAAMLGLMVVGCASSQQKLAMLASGDYNHYESGENRQN